VSLAVPVCDKCGEALELADIKAVSGPGAARN
jgi:hypothetical protein